MKFLRQMRASLETVRAAVGTLPSSLLPKRSCTAQRMNLDGKVVLITGASSGLGREIALSLSHRSVKLVVTARRENLLQELAAEVEANGSECLVCPADAT
ncbi:MAG: FlaA1/EpsC-like NDP-sugar epimerase, partial [Bradymonadia bacterium]